MENREIECYKKAGKIAITVKKMAREMIKPEMKLIDIAIAIDDKITELGAEPAFPVNLSIDSIAAHFTPSLASEEVAHGILKVDIGVAIEGYIADTAFTLDLTKEGIHKEMIELNEEIQGNVMKNLKYAGKIKDVGDIVQDTLEEWNNEKESSFSVIKGLSGHQLAQNVIHAGLTVSNYRNNNETPLKDMAIAVEPFVTTGNGEIIEGKGGGIYALTSNDIPRDRDARAVLEFIKKTYKTRPFCKRFLERAGFKKLGFILSTLEKQGILHHYPELIEKTRSPVSQVENTFVFFNGEKLITTSD